MSAPSMPTEHQINKAHQTIVKLYPDARVSRVGPDGVSFDYPDKPTAESDYNGKPFGGKNV